MIEKYFIKDYKNAIKIGIDKDEELFTIGKGDIIIKKKEKMNQSSCKQSSFDYHGKDLVLIGKKGTFEIKRFVVIQTTEPLTDEYLFVNMHEEERKQIETWTTMKCGAKLFDSEFDNWSEGTCVLNEKIIGKENVVFVIEHNENEKFGYFFGSKIVENFDENDKYIGIPTDSRTFQFNLESNGRLNGMTKFEIKNTTDGGIELFKSDNDHLIGLGNIMLFKENKKDQSTTYQNGELFENNGIKTASLCGKQYPKKFSLDRIIVIQMN